jgi:hypothetical protein
MLKKSSAIQAAMAVAADDRKQLQAALYEIGSPIRRS